MTSNSFDLKYDIDSKSTDLDSTVEFFPDMDQFLEIEALDPPNHEPIVTEWCLQRMGTLRSRLEAIQYSKECCGQTHHNIWDSVASGQVYTLANTVFGYDGWSSNILEARELYQDFDKVNSLFSLKILVLVRIYLKDGFYIDGSGIGEAVNMPFTYMCYNKCKKQATLNATKSAIILMSDMCN